MKNKFISTLTILFVGLTAFSQSIQLSSLSPDVFCSTGRDTMRFSVNYTNIPQNSNVVFYQSTNPAFNPYLGQGDSIGFINVGSNTTGGGGQVTTTCPEILGIFIDACDQGGVLREVDNEYMVITSGNTGFNVSSLKIQLPNSSINVSGCPFSTPSAATMTQLRNGTCDATTLIAAGQADFIPANAIVIIFTGRGALYNYNFSSYCSSGQPIYILQNSCSPGTANFVNNAPNSCPSNGYRATSITVGTCTDKLTYFACSLTPFDNTNPNANDGNYVIHLPNTDTSSITNGGIRNNASDKCNGLRFDSISGATIIKFPIPNDGSANPVTNFCNTGYHYIKAITHPNGSQPVSNTLQYKLICLDVATNVNNLSFCSGGNAAVNISSTDPNATFSWSVSGGTSITGASAGTGSSINQTLNYSGATKDSLTYNITALDGGCSSTKSVKVVVNKCSTDPCDSWLNLNDTPSGISCGDLDIVGNKVTVECLFNKFPPVTSPHLVSKHQLATAVNYAIGPLNAEITTTNNGYVLLQAPCPPDPNKTYHVAMVYDGATFKYYRNGSLVASTNCSGNLINNDILLTIGQINQATGPDFEQFKGYMNEVRIWNIARTQSEIQANMFSSLPNPTTLTGLKGYYVFDNLLNKQGNSAFNGTILGTAQINKTNPQCVLSPLNAPTINLGIDTSYCGTFTRTLSTGNAATVWTNNVGIPSVTASQITVTQPGTYKATINSSCGNVSDFITISASPGITFDFGANTTSVCVGGSISLGAGNTFDNYTWSTGASTNSITVTQPGIYWVDVFKNGCKGSDTINVIQIDKEPKPNLGVDLALCLPISNQFSTGKANTTWFLNGAQVGTGATFTATQTGTYVARLTNSCGDVSDTVIITQSNTQQPINLGNDTSFCGSFSKVLSTGNAATVWSTGVTASSITVTQPGTYTATINTGCGVATDSIKITQSGGVIFDFGANTTSVCVGGSISLGAGNTFDNYIWSTGASTNSINITQPGKYWVDVFKNGCKGSDTITVIQIDKEPKPNLGKDTSFCGNFSKTLSTGNTQTEWFRNGTAVTTAASLVINQSGTYVARIANSCGIVSDTIIISAANALSLNLGNDTTLCTGNALVLNATVSGSNITYLWNTGEQTPRITVTQFSRYDVEVSNGSCTVADTILVDFTDPPVITSLGADTSICGAISFPLFTGDAGTIWSTGVTGPTITVTQPGRYIAENKNLCGSAKDTIVIGQFALPTVNIGRDSTICDSVTLSVGNGNYTSILWNTNDTTPSIVVSTSGVFTVRVANANCTNTDSVRIKKDCFYDVYIPTAFSPNGDGVNDVYVPLSNIKGMVVIDFVIFNRWGEKVFESKDFAPTYIVATNAPTDITKGWNGLFKGELAQQDDYVYFFTAKMPDDEVKIYKGTFALLR
jgi:gliding motility-associated-like protein